MFPEKINFRITLNLSLYLATIEYRRRFGRTKQKQVFLLSFSQLALYLFPQMSNHYAGTVAIIKKVFRI
jgi:hypothetical protein